MIKTKWFSFSTHLSISEIRHHLNNSPFNDVSRCGFELINSTSEKINGQFTEEMLSKIISTSPFGEEVVNLIRRYQTLFFDIYPISKNQFLLKLEAPPRSIKKLVYELNEIFGFGFTISQINLNLHEFLSIIESLKELKLISISKLWASNIYLSNTATSKVFVHSQKNAFIELSNKFNLENAQFERMVISVESKIKTYQLDISTSCLICAEPEIAELLPKAISTYLIKSN